MNKKDHHILSRAAINPKYIHDRCFRYAFMLMQYYKEIKYHTIIKYQNIY